MTTTQRKVGLVAVIVLAVIAILGFNANNAEAAPLPARASTAALQGYVDSVPAGVLTVDGQITANTWTWGSKKINAAPSLAAAFDCTVRGDQVNVDGDSNGKVVAKEGGKRDLDIWPYYGSCTYYHYTDVDYFWVPGGCDAYNYVTGYRYAGNKTYGPLPGNAHLLFTVIC